MCMWKEEVGKKINYPFTLVLQDLFIALVFKYLFKFNLKYIFKAFKLIDPYCAEKSSFFVCRLSESGQDPDPSEKFNGLDPDPSEKSNGLDPDPSEQYNGLDPHNWVLLLPHLLAGFLLSQLLLLLSESESRAPIFCRN